MAKEAKFLTVKYLTGLAQSLAVLTPTNISCCSVGASAPELEHICWLLGVIEEFLNLKFFLWAN
jgi:hypothetical protein